MGGCVTCHADVIDGSGAISAPALHINGQVESSAYHPDEWSGPGGGDPGPAFNSGQSCAGSSCHGDAGSLTGAAARSCNDCHDSDNWRTDCTFCHGGTDNSSGAPPAGVDGETAASFLGVGAHTEHVEASDHPAYDCDVCHPARSDALEPGHIDGGSAEIAFSGQADGARYNAGRCSNLYCHGDGTGAGGSATWTGAESCGGCHGLPPDTGHHGDHSSFACYECHNGVVNASNQLVAGQTLHVNGEVDLKIRRSGITLVGTTCDGGCHGENHQEDDDWYGDPDD
jgi:predicted CxxxxCH...CXXCH cytochrome family protein